MPIAEIATAHRSRLTFAHLSDLETFVEKLGKFERGEISSEEWRAFRLVHGTYGQRQDGDLHMLRVNVSNLRHKIERDAARPEYLLTEPGVGYRLHVSASS